MIRAGAIAAAIALAACAGHGAIPSAPGVQAPSTFGDASPLAAFGDASPLALKTCAKDPPQWQWILKGACDAFTLKPTGGTFTLGTYDDISVKGSIGYNSLKGTATIDLADAIDKNGDIESYKGKSFTPYKGKGTTVVYAVADNQTSETIKPKSHAGKPVLQYVITDSKGFPGKTCGAAILGSKGWSAFPSTFGVKGHTVTITQYSAPSNLELPPKGYGLYFAINCF